MKKLSDCPKVLIKQQIKRQILLHRNGVSRADLVIVLERQGFASGNSNLEDDISVSLRHLRSSGFVNEQLGRYYYTRKRFSKATAPWRKQGAKQKKTIVAHANQ